MDNRFLRAEAILGPASMEKLRRSHVAVLGLGGVGSWCAEALARAGVGAITVMDMDTVSETNVNRQSIALSSTLGQPKAEVMARRIRDIAPECAVTPVVGRYEAETREEFFAGNYDFIADAIDLVACKLDLICEALRRGVPIISALGTGNKRDAGALRICDIAKTEADPLARVVRRELRARGVNHHTVVFSPEQAAPAAQLEAPPPGRRSVPGSLVWVPASAGLLMCQHIVTSLIEEQ
ncbi:MAG: tRNA threonylcarbamoyladenosine dehydratase [Ruminococcaceae bacterium]|nr:tRNA threonylcarbamoyladenosine dehydratase [Oscillospiraceae bacterium]